MVVVKVCMWPLGRRTHERVLCVAAIDCVGVAREDGPSVRKGERAYRVRLFKGVQFGGPDGSKDLPLGARTWKTGGVRGHVPGGHGAAARGEWDLLAGALNAVLGSRIDGYVACDAGAREPVEDDPPSRFTAYLCLECDRPLTQEEQDANMLCEHCDPRTERE